jgi:hypothetical protein
VLVYYTQCMDKLNIGIKDYIKLVIYGWCIALEVYDVLNVRSEIHMGLA